MSPKTWAVASPTQMAAAVTITTTTEKVAATTLPLTTDGANQTVNIDASGEVTTGTGTTSIQIRVRRGTGITGTQVGVTQTITTTAGNLYPFSIQVADTPGEVDGQQYVVTVQQVAATGNGTIDQAAIQPIIQ